MYTINPGRGGTTGAFEIEVGHETKATVDRTFMASGRGGGEAITMSAACPMGTELIKFVGQGVECDRGPISHAG